MNGTARASAILVVVFLVALATFQPITSAGSSTLSFEFGEGTANSLSTKVAFKVPCRSNVTVTVRYQRKGDLGVRNDVPFLIELLSPGPIGTTDDGPVQQSIGVIATTAVKSTTLQAQGSTRSCETSWRVRFKPKTGSSPWAIFGSVTLSFPDNTQNVPIEGGEITLAEGISVTKNIGGPSGLREGKLNIRTNWGMPGHLSTQGGKLKVEVIDPQGNVVKHDIGHASNGALAPILNLNYDVASCLTGQWKVRFTNNSNTKIRQMEPVARLTPDCLDERPN